MTSESPGGTSDRSDVRRTQDELLLQAVSVLQRRYVEGDPHPDLPSVAASELSGRLSDLATGRPVPSGVDRDEALALAHRLIDDDHPEFSPLWPEPRG